MNASPATLPSATPAAIIMMRAAILALGALTLAGCTDRLATDTTVSDDYQERHRIVLGERPVTLNLFASRKLDDGAKRRIQEFASEARSEGAPVVEVLTPAGAFNDSEARAILPAITTVLRESGLTASISAGSYPAADPRAMSPIRLSFRAVRARVSHRCGEWPLDLASASSLEAWDNRPYWNLGCAYQNMIATQLDDPRDLEAPRASTPSDVQMRTRAIGDARQASAAGGGPGAGVGAGRSAAGTSTGSPIQAGVAR